MNATTRATKIDWKQSGASAVEFALLLPLLLALSYSTIVYGYVFMVYESLNYAAHQAAESAIAVDPASPDYGAQVAQRSRQTAAAALNWMPPGHKTTAVGTAGDKVQVDGCNLTSGGDVLACGIALDQAQAISVTIDFPLLIPPVFPLLTLPYMGTVPPLPASIRGNGIVMVNG